MLTNFSQTGTENPQGDDKWRLDAGEFHDEDVNSSVLSFMFFSMITARS